MKKLCFVFLFVVLLSVNCFAVDIYSDNFKVASGNTYLGVFETSSLSDLQKDNIRSFLDNELNFIVYKKSTSQFLLLSLSNESGFNVDSVNSDSCDLVLNCGASGTVWNCDGAFLSYDDISSFSSGSSLNNVVLVTGKAFSSCSIVLPSPVSSYCADYEGSLYLTDDGGLMGEPVEEEQKEDNGILSFLSDFWTNFTNSLKSIFVPSDGYFKTWYEDVSSAASEKFSGITSIFTCLQDFFRGISGNSGGFTLDIPEDSMFDGSPSFNIGFFNDASDLTVFLRGVLTGIIVLITLIICYRKLSTLFEQ